METLNIIYMIKIFLGALAGILCVLLGVNDIFSGIIISLAVYVSSDRLLKQIFIEKVEKQSIITRTGVGIYIISWIFFWILIYTFIHTYG